MVLARLLPLFSVAVVQDRETAGDIHTAPQGLVSTFIDEEAPLNCNARSRTVVTPL